MEHLEIYNNARSVPDEALKTIQAGRLKGMSDINPMWRIKRLTELFGPCGIGWWYEIVNKQIVEDSQTKQSAAFVDILLYFTDVNTGAVSHGIPGTGGSTFSAQERNGPYMSDECFKMALTDAISVAAKALGVGADVYFGKDRTKYDSEDGGAPTPKPPSPELKTPSPLYSCDKCGSIFAPGIFNGVKFTQKEAYDKAFELRGAHICGKCDKAQKAENASE